MTPKNSILLISFSAFLTAGCHAGAGRGGGPPDLEGIGHLQELFNAQTGKPRLVLLLSPT